MTPPKSPSGGPWQISLLAHEEATHHQEIIARNRVEPTGIWTSPNVRPGAYAIVVGTSGEDSVTRQDVRMESSDLQVTMTIQMTRVRGTLKFGGQPLSAVVWVGGRRHSPSVALKADSDGAFSGEVPFSASQDWLVTVDSEQPRIERTFTKRAVQESDGTLRLDISLPRNAIHGIVVDEQGKPVSRTIINVTAPDSAQTFLQTHGDDTGQFELMGLASGAYSIEALTFDHRQSKPVRVSVDPDAEAEVKLVVEGQRAFSGRVVAQASPVPGTAVTFIPTNVEPNFWPNDTTDTKGDFHIDLPPGADEGNLIVAAPGYSFKMFHLKLPGEPITVAIDSTGGALDLDVPAFVDDPAALQTFIVHRGAEVNAQFIASAQGVRLTAGKDGRIHFVHPLMEPSDYSLCVAMMSERAALRSGLLPKERCSSGILAPFGTLRLTGRPSSH